jgi:hypothetical protein
MTSVQFPDAKAGINKPATSFTVHGAVQSQRRSIPRAVVEGLQYCGEAEHDGHGAERYFFTKRSWRKFCSFLGTEAKHYDRYRSAYVVISDKGLVITTGWRH